MTHRSILLYLLSLFMLLPAQAQQVRHAYAVEVKGGSLVVRNLTDGFLKLTFEITGENFKTDAECRQTWFLGPRRETTHKVVENDSRRKTQFNVFVTVVEYTSKAEERERSAGKPIPEAEPLNAEQMKRFSGRGCASG